MKNIRACWHGASLFKSFKILRHRRSSRNQVECGHQRGRNVAQDPYRTWWSIGKHHEDWTLSADGQLSPLERSTGAYHPSSNGGRNHRTPSVIVTSHLFKQWFNVFIHAWLYISFSHRDELNQLNNKLKCGCDSAQNAYLDSYAAVHTDPAFYQGTALHPPVCLMLEWLDDINTVYSMRYA